MKRIEFLLSIVYNIYNVAYNVSAMDVNTILYRKGENMPYDLIGKILLLALSSFSVIFSLLTIAKKKKHFQIFPESIRKEYYKIVRNMTIANSISAILIIAGLYWFSTNFVYLLLIISMFLSVASIHSVYDEFGETNE
ncbi:hypothetical protein ACWGKP_20935 [Brevibacillus sp. NPDC055896]